MERKYPLPLTDKQKSVLAFITKYINTNNYPPTLREVQTAVKINNIGLVHKNLTALERKGYIEREKRMPRGIILTEIAESINEARQMKLNYNKEEK